MKNGKIARLPRLIREELDRRLDQADSGRSLLGWLNSLPEVQAIINAQFKGKPVDKQSLSRWKNTGLRAWQLAQTALQYTDNALPEDLDAATLEKTSAKLIRCLPAPTTM